MKLRVLSLILVLIALFSLTACDFSSIVPEFESETPYTAPEKETEKATEEATVPETEPAETENALPEDGEYDSRDEVALYIHLYGRLPSNYITKKEAEKLGWSGGGLDRYAPGKSIGGSRFGNYEGLLPEAPGREYRECDIDTRGKSSRGAKRIVYSNDGLIYYTDDHYESFVLLYGDEGS
ncbi:MAG: ribonuclease [Clostridia bacterium]|nr:ribonuclease [Clostridia bacterium]